MIIVTSYESPDLDGVACSVAYSELLNILGKESRALYFGKIGLEVDFVKHFLKGLTIKDKINDYPDNADFVLVDTSDPDAIDPEIPPEKVLEIFDHRELVFTEKFVNAQINIELVGSCATLIAEKFGENKINPSRSSATLLYSAIISNTINFKNFVTTKRDIKMANRLKNLLNLPADYIEQMFVSKSNVSKANFEEIIGQDFAVKEMGGRKIGIAQIEVAHLDELLAELGDETVNVLKKLKKEEKLDYILFTGIDVFKGVNTFVYCDKDSKKLFTKILPTTGSIIMRKQIWPKLNSLLTQG